jgi:signal transduction histidine kinase
MARATALRVKQHRVLDPADLDQIAGLVTTAASDARNIARGLHRSEVDAASFVEGLDNLARREIWKVPCRVQIKKPFRIDDDKVAMNLYAIAREAVINANKHAQAHEILIQLSRSPKEIVLTVVDDGVGLKEDTRKSGGMGLHIMQFRAHSIGGRLEVESYPGSGTRVHCFVPLLHENR